MDNKITEIITLAILTESIITYSKEFLINGDFSFSMLWSLIIGILISVAYKLDLPKYLNLKSNIPYVGSLLSGILISRGSNYIFDLLKTITSIKG